jgi:gliding motility-associated-like protein
LLKNRAVFNPLLLSFKLSYKSSGRIIAFLCTMFFCFAAKAQLAADFRSDVTSGCAPLVVQFTDLTTGNPTEWAWNFGNGNTSNQQNPGTIYFAAGTYTVTLVVTNANGSSSKTQVIEVYQKPSIDFTADDTSGCAPLVVHFTGVSSGPSEVSTWSWDFGDGTSSTVASPEHTYLDNGSYPVTLKVSNSNGCAAVLTKPSFIKVKKAKAGFSILPFQSCKPPVQVSFVDSSSGGTLVYTWSFGDGVTSSDPNPSHTYTTSGIYNVRLQVTNELGCLDSMSKQIDISAVTADFQTPVAICPGSAAGFVNTSTPSIVSSFWDFGDGTTSVNNNPQKTYNSGGSYVVKLVNNFGNCKDSITKKVTVLPAPSSDFSFTTPITGCALPMVVTLNNNSANSYSFLWDFGDSSTSTDPNPNHTYTDFGSFSVTLTATAGNGCSTATTKKNIVVITPVKINRLNNLPISGCFPRSQTFSADITSSEEVTSYFWDFGDNTTSTLKNPVHDYTVAGSYDVSLIVKTGSGCTDTFRLPAAVTVSPKPIAKFGANPLTACSHDLINFYDSSSNISNNWIWNFGDGSSSTEQNPVHHYVDTGYFNVTLIAGDNKCYDTVTVHDYIYINPPVAKAAVLFNCDSPYVRHFYNNSINAQTISWDFGDGNLSSDTNPTHVYASSGTYITILKVQNGNCYDEFRDTIVVKDEKPSITASKNLICKNSQVEFAATNIDPSDIVHYKWTFGDDSLAVGTVTPSVTHVYSHTGTYRASLIITDKAGCQRKADTSLTLTVYGPKAFVSAPAAACANTPVAFVDSSVAYPGYPISSWVLNYGDGVSDTSPTFSHAYNVAGIYTVTLAIGDTAGCADTSKPIVITVTAPKALFSVVNTLSCTHSKITFTDSSTGTGLNYLWTFGDSTTSNSRQPIYSYNSEGVYNISLTVTDSFGCSSTYTKDTAIVVRDPNASFTMSDSIIPCPPAQINFASRSSNISRLNWDFDDGSFATIDSPSHFFSTAGVYYVRLIAYGYGSCIDSTQRKIIVQGPSGTFTYDKIAACSPALINFNGSATNNRKSFLWDFGDGSTVRTSAVSVSHTYTRPGRYMPKLLLQDTTLNCTVSVFGADTITAIGIKSYVSPIRKTFCDSATIQLFDSSQAQYDTIKSYYWTFGDGGTATSQNPYHTFSDTGVYSVRLKVTTAGNCTDTSASAFVKVRKSPQVKVTGDTAVCVNQPANFVGVVGADTSLLTWRWNFKNGNISNLASPPSQLYISAGFYTVIASVTNSFGCTTNAQSPLRVHPLPPINAGPDQAICRGQNIVLNVFGAESYVWKSSPTLSCTRCSAPVASPLNADEVYFVTGKVGACENTDSVVVKVIQPTTVKVSVADTICIGKSANLLATGADVYTWSPSAGLNDANIANPIATPDTTTMYIVIGHDYKNCFADTAYVPVTVYPIPVFQIQQHDFTIPVGNSVTLNTTGSPDIVRWNWYPPTHLSCSNCPEPVATPIENSTYKAIVSNLGGCTAEDQVTINVFCNNGNVFIPNTFSPNNDGSNDVFYPRGKGVSVRSMQIFNRWGVVVYQKTNFAVNDPQAGWDGTYNGRKLDADVFVYRIDVVCETGQVFSSKGDITLIR